jgi:competence protein ComEA
MRISELLEKLNSFLSSFVPQSIHRISNLFSHVNPQSALRIPHFSIGQQKVLFVLALLILAVLYLRFYFHPHSPPSEEIFREIVVEVSGEVHKPGIYIFKNPPTLKETIEKAGGLKEPALFNKNSFSEILESGTQINVRKESSQEIKLKIGRMEANKLLTFSIPLDLNRVSVEDLRLIPGIGESLAREIVTYRERRRGFRSVEELKNVKGIGKKKWKTFKTSFIVTQPFRVDSSGLKP